MLDVCWTSLTKCRPKWHSLDYVNRIATEQHLQNPELKIVECPYDVHETSIDHLTRDVHTPSNRQPENLHRMPLNWPSPNFQKRDFTSAE